MNVNHAENAHLDPFLAKYRRLTAASTVATIFWVGAWVGPKLTANASHGPLWWVVVPGVLSAIFFSHRARQLDLGRREDPTLPQLRKPLSAQIIASAMLSLVAASGFVLLSQYRLAPGEPVLESIVGGLIVSLAITRVCDSLVWRPQLDPGR